MDARPPRGTVTFLFTDVEGSTRLLKELRDDYGYRSRRAQTQGGAAAPRARSWRHPARISRERALVAAAAALVIAAVVVGLAVAMGRHEAGSLPARRRSRRGLGRDEIRI
jgi:hypothetical protein